jgi:hypothetical protein
MRNSDFSHVKPGTHLQPILFQRCWMSKTPRNGFMKPWPRLQIVVVISIIFNCVATCKQESLHRSLFPGRQSHCCVCSFRKTVSKCTCIAVRYESHLAQPQITSLCASVKAAATSQGVSLCIGLLPHQTHKHSLYKEPLKPTVTRISLPDVVELAQARQPNASILPMVRRYRLAFVLASSLLHFGSSSTSWFSRNWRSEDLFFLQKQSTSSSNGDFIDFPHIAVTFPTCDAVDNSRARGTFLAQDRQLFALAIALIEIAHGT